MDARHSLLLVRVHRCAEVRRLSKVFKDLPGQPQMMKGVEVGSSEPFRRGFHLIRLV